MPMRIEFRALRYAPILAALVFGSWAGFVVMVGIPLAMHAALGTPEILLAIAPGVLWGSLFIAGCVWTAEVHS